jgi:hypothetical protein
MHQMLRSQIRQNTVMVIETDSCGPQFYFAYHPGRSVPGPTVEFRVIIPP